jgi:hypothetical protein
MNDWVPTAVATWAEVNAIPALDLSFLADSELDALLDGFRAFLLDEEQPAGQRSFAGLMCQYLGLVSFRRHVHYAAVLAASGAPTTWQAAVEMLPPEKPGEP